MRTTPPSEEPGAESEIDYAESYSLPQRRHRGADSGHLPRRIFHSDEHPEIPKIKRASRYSSTKNDLAIPQAEIRQNLHKLIKNSSIEDKLAGSDKLQKDATAMYSTKKTFLLASQPRYTLEASPALDYTHQRAFKREHSIPGSPRVGIHQLERQRKQPLALLTAFQQLMPPQQRMVIGSLLLLLGLVVTTTVLHGAPKDTQMQANSHTNNTISSRNTDAGNAHQILITPPNSDHPAPPILATSAYVLDADSGATLYASNPFMHLPMLSTTKLMTALIATQIGDPNQSILINDTIANDMNQLLADSSLMGIKRGETYTLKDLLYGLLLVSGNDAAVAIADQLGAGNQQNFVDKMNQKAAQLGLYDTHFINAHGLPAPEHFSSAHDLALLTKDSLSVPLLQTISSTREYDIPKNDKHEKHTMSNENQFLWWYPGVDGGKQGWDDATDFVQVISCIRNHHHLIGVVMHTVDWWTDMRDLMNWGFNTFNWLSPHDVFRAGNPIPFAAAWQYFNKDKQETTIPTADQGRYYIYTGYSIAGSMMTYFDTHGGLKTFGYPIAQVKVFSDRVVSQRFEHSEIHCDLKTKQCNMV